MADNDTWSLSRAIDHITAAETLMVTAPGEADRERASQMVAAAQVHATLATAVASVLELVVKRSALDIMATEGDAAI